MMEKKYQLRHQAAAAWHESRPRPAFSFWIFRTSKGWERRKFYKRLRAAPAAWKTHRCKPAFTFFVDRTFAKMCPKSPVVGQLCIVKGIHTHRSAQLLPVSSFRAIVVKHPAGQVYSLPMTYKQLKQLKQFSEV